MHANWPSLLAVEESYHDRSDSHAFALDPIAICLTIRLRHLVDYLLSCQNIPNMASDDDLPPDLEDMTDKIAAQKHAKDDLEHSLADSTTKRRDATSLAGEVLGGVTVGKSLADAALPAAVKSQLQQAEQKKGQERARWDYQVEPGSVEDTLQKQMMEASLAAKSEVEKELKQQESKVTKDFMKGTAIKKGFLLGGKSTGTKPASGAKASGTEVVKSSSAASSQGTDDIPFIRPTGEDNLRLNEVQEALKSQVPAMASTLADKSKWMTPEFMQRVARDPRLAAGLRNPRWMAALGEMASNPKAAMEKYKSDAGLQDFLRNFMGLMGDHFSKLGESDDVQKQFDGGTGSTSSSAAAAGGLSKSSATGAAGPDLTPSSTRKLNGGGSSSAPSGPLPSAGGPWPTAGILAPDSNVSSDEIADAAASGRLPTADDEVRKVMSNKALIDILRDPGMQRILEECRLDGRKLQHYMRDPDIKRKFVILSKAGLIRIE